MPHLPDWLEEKLERLPPDFTGELVVKFDHGGVADHWYNKVKEDFRPKQKARQERRDWLQSKGYKIT